MAAKVKDYVFDWTIVTSTPSGIPTAGHKPTSTVFLSSFLYLEYTIKFASVILLSSGAYVKGCRTVNLWKKGGKKNGRKKRENEKSEKIKKGRKRKRKKKNLEIGVSTKLIVTAGTRGNVLWEKKILKKNKILKEKKFEKKI